MEEILKKYSLLNAPNAPNVSRETCLDFEKFISMVLEKNHEINIISKNSSKNDLIRERHIIDSAQAIDFIDLNSDTTSDLGTGGGMPGIVLAIMLKNLGKKVKINLYEKSYHKSSFLKEVSKNLNLDTEIIQRDIFKLKEIDTGTIIARAFKPMPLILELVHKNFNSYKNLILFMGKNGKSMMQETMKAWDFDFTERKSLTSEDSFLLNIRNIKKKKLN
jgi:16S rRNA (guanine527-N7)-methyltransferase